MPLPKATRYAMKGNVRLAFGKGGKVIEAKNMDAGATHTPAEFRDGMRQMAKKHGMKHK